MGRTARLLCAYSLDGGWVLCRWVGWQPGSPVFCRPDPWSGGHDGTAVGGLAAAGPTLRGAVQGQGFPVGGDPAVRRVGQDLGQGGGLLLIGERVVGVTEHGK